MRRFAFFVEGATESLFIERVLQEYFNRDAVAICVKTIRGGSKKNPIQIREIRADPIISAEYYFLIYDCGGESNVCSYLKEQRTSLMRTGYEKLFALRDVFPNFTRQQIPKLISRTGYGIPQQGLPTKITISIMEIESWFLAEENHFANISASITQASVKAILGLDPAIDDTQNIDEPANRLHDIYQLAGLAYEKTIGSIKRTVDSLDMDNLLLNSRCRNASLDEFVKEIEAIIP
ncbi:MAG: hypothetical protein IPO40_10510 [Fibrobacteres bacterium]|nr:hypothetical protein [Fibrobacterota bacterium]